MIDIQRILCPIDFSEPSRHALQQATAIAKWYHATMEVLYVYHPTYVLMPPVLVTESPGVLLPTEEDRPQLETQLHDWVAPAIAAGVDTRTEIRHGSPAQEILSRATALAADLIVMGTHGRSGFERLLLGSVTEKVLRKARVPVLTVPPPAHTTSNLPYKRMLCPIDFSEPSLLALKFAMSLARESDAHLTVMHVFEWPSADEMYLQPFDVPEFRRQCEADVLQRLDALVADTKRTWYEPSTKVSHGKAYRQILEAAEADEADLIVMGVHGRNVFDMMVFGSTTNHVVRQASCPVLTLKP